MRRYRTPFVLIFLSLSLVLMPSVDVKTQPSVSISILSGGTPSGSITSGDVEAGFDVFLDETTLEVTANVDWQVTANVTVIGVPAGTGDSSGVPLEVGNNDNPGEFNAGGGLVQTGTSGTSSFTVDFRLNLSALGNGPSGAYNYQITYTVEPL